MAATRAAEAKAAEAKAAAEKKKAQEAKDLFNVPAPAAATQQASGTAATQQASGNSDQRAVSFSPPAILPPAPGQKPTILHRLINMPEEEFKTKLFDVLTEAMNGDSESQKELAKILTSTVRGEVMGFLLAIKRSSHPALGHSLFEYFAQLLRKDDQHHGAHLFYVGDRGLKDPTAFEMDEDTVKAMGGAVLVEGVKDQSLIKEFYEKEENKGKLFIPKEDAEMMQRQVAAVLPASKGTMKFVLEKKPTFLELFKYAEGVDDPNEKKALQDWALHACQTPPGDNSRRPSSILAGNLVPVLGASEELEELLVSRLDQTIGPAAPVSTPPR